MPTIVVTGSRRWKDREMVRQILASLDDGTTIVHGDGRGLDKMVDAMARAMPEKGFTVIAVPADWDDLTHPLAVIRHHPDGLPYNAAAGPCRNQRMIDEHKPDRVIAFPMPGSQGTWDCVERANVARIPVEIHRSKKKR